MAALGPPEPLGPGHDAAGFTCGVPPLDAWLRRAPPAGVFVVHAAGRIRGFYTLSAGSVREAGGPPGRSLPIMKLGRLAVDGDAQRRGLGTALLLDAFVRTYAVSRLAPVDALIADPPPAVAAWFHDLGFLPAPGDASAMFVALGTIEKLVEGK